MTGGPFEPEQLRDFRAEFQRNPALAVVVLRTFVPVPEPVTVLIRCDAARVEKAVARALARAVIKPELGEIEVVRGHDADPQI